MATFAVLFSTIYFVIEPRRKNDAPRFHDQVDPVDLQKASKFTISVRDRASRQKVDKVIRRISAAEVEAILKAKQRVTHVTDPTCAIKTYYTNSVASNDPIEDAHAEIIQSTGDGRHRALFGVYDGHSGWQLSMHLKDVFISSILKALDSASKQSVIIRPWQDPFSLLKRARSQSAKDLSVSEKLSQAFQDFDAKICAGPLSILDQHGARKAHETKSSAPTAEEKHIAALAMSGACVLLTLYDSATKDLYVANTGDCRAVAGYLDPTTGRWRAEALSEDQTAATPREVARMIHEHPASESQDVVKNGRVLGGLQPSRTFGDAAYKWTAQDQKAIQAYFSRSPSKRDINSMIKTPPYVTARPEIVHKHDPVGAGLKFVVMATDGLWDVLSNEDAVALVANKLQAAAKDMTRSTLYKNMMSSRKHEGSQMRYSFTDDNLATHLIRNALGGAKTAHTSALLSIPAPLSRRFRDDITVSVILFNDQV